MSYALTTGWRGFSTARESAFGQPATVDTSLNFQGPPIEPVPNRVSLTEDAGAGIEPTAQDIRNWKLMGTHRQKALPHAVALFGSIALGKVTSSQPDPVNDPSVYRHRIEVEGWSLPSRTMVEYNGHSTKRYPGVCVARLEIIGEGDFLELAAALAGRGEESSIAMTRPDQPGESYLRYGDVELTKGGTYDGNQVTGGTSIGADLSSFRWVCDNKPGFIYEPKDSSGFVSSVERHKIRQELRTVFRLKDDSHRNDLKQGSEFVLHIPIVGAVIQGGSGAYQFGIDLVFPKVVYRQAEVSSDRNWRLMVTADFQVLEDPLGSVVLTVTNQQSNY